MTTPLPGLDNITADPAPARPWRYLVVEQDRSDVDPITRTGPVRLYIHTRTNDLEYAIADATRWEGHGEPGAVFDNWAGAFVLQPDWAEQLEVTADGWARWDCRPQLVSA